MKKLTPDHLNLNGYHRIMHLAVFLLGYASASVFGVFILCYSLDSSFFTEQLYPAFLRFLELYIDWSVGFCFIFALLCLFAEFIRTRFFPQSYRAENIFFFSLKDSCWFKKISARKG
jgi:hypothetical protein